MVCVSIRGGGAFGFGAALGGSFATTKSETQKEGSRNDDKLINLTYNVSSSRILYPQSLFYLPHSDVSISILVSFLI